MSQHRQTWPRRLHDTLAFVRTFPLRAIYVPLLPFFGTLGVRRTEAALLNARAHMVERDQAVGLTRRGVQGTNPMIEPESSHHLPLTCLSFFSSIDHFSIRPCLLLL